MMPTPARANDIVLRFTWDDSFEDVYASWHREAIVAERAHRRMSDRLSRRAAVLSVASVLLMLLVAAGTVALVRVEPDVLAKFDLDAKRLAYGIAGVAVLAAVAVVAQSLGRFEARAEAHRAATNAYRALERAMAMTLAMPRSARRPPDTALNDARERLDRYAERSPAIGTRAARSASLALEEDRASSSLRLGREVPDPLV